MKTKLKKFTGILFITLFCVFIFHGCATSGLSNEPIRFHKDYSENGIMIASISFEQTKAHFNGYFPLVACVNSNEKTARKNTKQIVIRPAQMTKMKHKGELNDGKTYLVALELVPSKYQISNIRLFEQGIGGYTRDSNLTISTIPFEVKKGEIIYIGEIKINESTNTTSLNDEFLRDLNGIKAKQTMVNWDLALKSEFLINLNK